MFELKKSTLRQAIDMCQWKPDKCIIFQRRNILLSDLDSQIDLNWEEGEFNLYKIKACTYSLVV